MNLQHRRLRSAIKSFGLPNNMHTTQIPAEAYHNRSIRFSLNDQWRSGVVHAFRTTEKVRVAILMSVGEAPDRVRQSFVLLNPRQWERIEPDPDHGGELVLRESLRTPVSFATA